MTPDTDPARVETPGELADWIESSCVDQSPVSTPDAPSTRESWERVVELLRSIPAPRPEPAETDEDVARVMELDAKATKGPWKSFHDHGIDVSQEDPIASAQPAWLVIGNTIPQDYRVVCRTVRKTGENEPEDAAIIAEYRTLAPRLAAALAESRAECRRVEGERDRFRKIIHKADGEPRELSGAVKYGEYDDEGDTYLPPDRLPNIPTLESERDTARAELAAAKKDCPWDLPFDSICPKHGGPIAQCPINKANSGISFDRETT